MASDAASTNAHMRRAVRQARAGEHVQPAAEPSPSAHAPNPAAEQFHYSGLTWRIQNKLGQGGNAVIWEAICQETLEFLAVKVQTTNSKSSEGQAVYLLSEEYKILSNLRHPNIIGVYGLVTSPQVGMLLELGNSNLFDWLQAHKLEDPDEEYLDARKRLTNQLLSALHYVSSKRVLHGDIKPWNCIMFGRQVVVKLADFGCATEIPHRGSFACPGDGLYTPMYRPPELLAADKSKAEHFTKLFKVCLCARLWKPHALLK